MSHLSTHNKGKRGFRHLASSSRVTMGLIAPNQWTAFQSVTHRVIHRLCHVDGPVSIKDDPHAQLPFVALPAC